MKSPNNIVIDNIDNDHIIDFHKELDTLREKYKVRIRIKDNGRANKSLRILPPAKECYEELK